MNNFVKFVFIIAIIVLFPLCASAQIMGKENLADAIIAAMEYCNDRDSHIEKREYIVADKIMIFETSFDFIFAPDSLVEELNKKSRFDFFTEQHDYIKKHNIKKMEFVVIHNYRIIDSNNVILAVSGGKSYYKKRFFGKFKPTAICPDKIFMISSRSAISNKWIIYHADFVYYLSEKNGIYDDLTLATMLHNNLLHDKLNTIDEFVLLFNYLRKKEETPQDNTTNELLRKYIETHPETKEILKSYFLLLSTVRIHGDNAHLIEENYKKITEKTH